MPTRLLTIAAELSAPPSSPTCFRELTMVAAAVRGYTVVAVSPEELIWAYRRWYAVYGLFDYLTDLVPPRELIGESIAVEVIGGPSAKLTAHNLGDILAIL